jgi:hypothetical protein
VVRRARDRAADGLTRLFSEDELTVEELEERLDRCYRARSVDELEGLFADLPAQPDLSAAARHGPEEGPEGTDGGRDAARSPDGRTRERSPARRDVDRKERGLALAFWSGIRRAGNWTPPEHMSAVAVMGGAELDFRDARFPPGVTTVTAVALMGGVEIVVPPGVRVESSGIPVMGGFDRLDQDGNPDAFPDAVLRIRGVACMGGVEVKVRPPGSGE